MGLKDSRDGFSVFIKVVEKIQPTLWMFENVRGVMYRNKTYLHEIVFFISVKIRVCIV